MENSYKQIKLENEAKANKYIINGIFAIIIVLSLVLLLNEINVFEVSKNLFRTCYAITFFLFSLSLLTINKKVIENHYTKYILLIIVELIVLELCIFLNVHVYLALIIPLLFATQYASYKYCLASLIGSQLCCIVAPILAYLFKTWNLTFLLGYVETTCNVTLHYDYVNTVNDLKQIGRIMLYLVLPQFSIICVLGLISFTVTKNNKESIRKHEEANKLAEGLNKQLEMYIHAQDKWLFSIADLVENRDSSTGGHIKRTNRVVKLLVEEMMYDKKSGMDKKLADYIVKAAPLHDLGKITIDDAILRKPGKLTKDEFEVIKTHASKSAEIIYNVLFGLEDDKFINVAFNIAKYHHERWDGTGYPRGLKGNEIPLEARIMAIADVYDALVSERCYKKPMSFDQAFETIESLMGSQFDPHLNTYFTQCKSKIEDYYIYKEKNNK